MIKGMIIIKLLSLTLIISSFIGCQSPRLTYYHLVVFTDADFDWNIKTYNQHFFPLFRKMLLKAEDGDFDFSVKFYLLNSGNPKLVFQYSINKEVKEMLRTENQAVRKILRKVNIEYLESLENNKMLSEGNNLQIISSLVSLKNELSYFKRFSLGTDNRMYVCYLSSMRETCDHYDPGKGSYCWFDRQRENELDNIAFKITESDINSSDSYLNKNIIKPISKEMGIDSTIYKPIIFIYPRPETIDFISNEGLKFENIKNFWNDLFEKAGLGNPIWESKQFNMLEDKYL